MEDRSAHDITVGTDGRGQIVIVQSAPSGKYEETIILAVDRAEDVIGWLQEAKSMAEKEIAYRKNIPDKS